MTNRRPVVIAGAGPTGLMCALALSRQGIPVVVFEAEPALTHDLRAGSFHPPTLEMMAPYGITERMLEIGIKVLAENIREKTVRHANSSFITMVAVDDDGKATPVPPLIPSTPDQVRRFEAAKARSAGGSSCKPC